MKAEVVRVCANAHYTYNVWVPIAVMQVARVTPRRADERMNSWCTYFHLFKTKST